MRRSIDEICWRLRVRSARAPSRARVSSRIASWRASGIHTLVSSPARNSLASPSASRRLVFTRSPAFFGTSDGATTMDDARVTEALDQPLQTVAGRAGLVAERQLSVPGRKPGDQLARGGLAGVHLAEKAHLAPPAGLGNRHRIAQLRRIDADESFAMMPHDSPSLCEALPSPSGQPSNAHRG